MSVQISNNSNVKIIGLSIDSGVSIENSNIKILDTTFDDDVVFNNICGKICHSSFNEHHITIDDSVIEFDLCTGINLGLLSIDSSVVTINGSNTNSGGSGGDDDDDGY